MELLLAAKRVGAMVVQSVLSWVADSAQVKDDLLVAWMADSMGLRMVGLSVFYLVVWTENAMAAQSASWRVA